MKPRLTLLTVCVALTVVGCDNSPVPKQTNWHPDHQWVDTVHKVICYDYVGYQAVAMSCVPLR